MEFLDTNVLVYAVDPTEPLRRAQARSLLNTLIEQRSLVVSTQVMLEFRAAVLRRNLLTMEQATEFLRHIDEEHILSTNAEDVWRAFEMQERYGFSIWDAMMIQSAIAARCDTIYTEDLQDGQRIGGLRVVNPFQAAVHEPEPPYKITAATSLSAGKAAAPSSPAGKASSPLRRKRSPR